mmetsp:Transcript_13011/g.46247  ORF Transcript_13011/g.46247 Transcript_13011/m.46247 type:complete len:562 (-) Transcript_13011:429-2114(-)
MSGFSGPKPAEIRGALGVDRNMTSEVVPTASQVGGFASMDKQNTGYSGTPMWKLALEREKEREKQTLGASVRTVKIPEGFLEVDKAMAAQLPAKGQWYFSEKRQVFWNAADEKFYVYDPATGTHKELYEAVDYELGVAVGSCFHETATQVKHVMVKDLAKAAQALRMSIEHLDRPCALYALYDGHRGGNGAGNACADFCVKNMQHKLLPKLAAYRGFWDSLRLESALHESFHELECEFAEKHPSAKDGCCAAVLLLMGQRLVLASVGDIACVLCTRGGQVAELFRPHVIKGVDDDDDEDDEDDEAGDSTDAVAQVAPPEVDGVTFGWTRTLGDLDLKTPSSSTRLLAAPEVRVLQLEPEHQGVALVSRALYKAVGRSVAVATVFGRNLGRPRMASGALVDAAVQWLVQVGDLNLGSVVLFFDKVKGAEMPLNKKPKQGQSSQVRVRHILLKHRECKSTVDKVRNKQVKRTRGEAERLLRAVLEQCASDPTKKATFTQRCKEISECQASLSAGDLAGDLGWLKLGKGKFGPAFDAAALALQVGQLSDLVDSDQGIHIILRSA